MISWSHGRDIQVCSLLCQATAGHLLQEPWNLVNLQILHYFNVSHFPHSELLLVLIFPRRQENSCKKGLGLKFRATQKWTLGPEMAPRKMTQDLRGLNSWRDGATLSFQLRRLQARLGIRRRNSEIPDSRALKDQQSNPAHVTEREAGLERGNDAPKVSGKESGRTRLECRSPASLANRTVNTWVPCEASRLSTRIS